MLKCTLKNFRPLTLEWIFCLSLYVNHLTYMRHFQYKTSYNYTLRTHIGLKTLEEKIRGLKRTHADRQDRMHKHCSTLIENIKMIEIYPNVYANISNG